MLTVQSQPAKKHRVFASLLSVGVAIASIALETLPVEAIDFRQDNNATVVAKWNQATLQAISASQMPPTPASRALAVVHTSIFEAWAAYDPVAIGTQMGDRAQVPSEQITLANKEAAISYAAYRTLVDLFPSQVHIFNNLMQELGYDYTQTSTNMRTPIGIGTVAAQKVIEYRRNDRANQANNYADTTGYNPPNDWNIMRHPTYWQPLRVENGQTVQQFITPHWELVTPFALRSANQFLPPPPPMFGTPDYVARALEVIEITAELDDRGKAAAEYWADGPGSVQPAGHWLLFGEFISQRDGHTLDDDVKMFFMLGNAVLDAGIAAWDAKTHYNYVRPITAIQYLAENKLLPENHRYVRTNPTTGVQEILGWTGPNEGSKWIAGNTWIPYQRTDFVSPPFAEYVSGHSAFSAAAAEIFKRYTGSDGFGGRATITPRSSTYESNTPQQPVVLYWETFMDAANESGFSRLYGGIHFRDANLNGLSLGRAVADRVWARSLYYINGGV
ncbi:vanadium-dependent haloperoxidase [Lusitaniella coriacea]|uniref:vanadium-dependent haloperoxidase n=1 Tax=Lusitaniella coriacea TaxID=1983105 RepID=UPI003CF9AB14